MRVMQGQEEADVGAKSSRKGEEKHSGVVREMDWKEDVGRTER